MADLTARATVSVVIPCYRQAHFLHEAIESVLAQTDPVEIIVVDDGSPDNTAEVAARYPGVRCVRQENRGLGGARNAGFRVSEGEYVLFLDADDRLLPDAVAAHLTCFAEHPEAGFVVGDIDNINADGSYLGSPRWPLLQGNVYEELLKVNHVANTIAVMFRRSVIERVGGFKMSCSPSEDVELLLHAARLFPSAHHRTTVAEYRRYGNTLTRRGTIMLPAILRVMRLQEEVVKGNPRLLRARRQGIAYWRDYFGRPAFEEVFVHLKRGQVLRAARTLALLLWYVRWQALIIPFKYWGRIVRKLTSGG
jgi:glycosyltransferase involved in cell wall biosynthesis